MGKFLHLNNQTECPPFAGGTFFFRFYDFWLAPLTELIQRHQYRWYLMQSCRHIEIQSAHSPTNSIFVQYYDILQYSYPPLAILQVLVR